MANALRVPIGVNQDNTGRQDTNDYKNPAYAATLNVVTRQKRTILQPGTLTGNMTLNVGVGTANNPPFIGDSLQVILLADASARTVTLGTGLVGSAATIVTGVGGKKAFLEFIFDGTAWIETSRAVLL